MEKRPSVCSSTILTLDIGTHALKGRVYRLPSSLSKESPFQQETSSSLSKVARFQQETPVTAGEGGLENSTSTLFAGEVPYPQETSVNTLSGECLLKSRGLFVALEGLLAEIKSHGVELGRVRCVTGCAQQHGSVYWDRTRAFGVEGTRNGARQSAEGKTDFDGDVGEINDGNRSGGGEGFFFPQNTADGLLPLGDLVKDWFASEDAPTWMDSSTEKECMELDKYLGGAVQTAALTGSVATERFMGPQLAKRLKENKFPDLDRVVVALISSAVTSVLCGEFVQMEQGDCSGTNLMDMATLQFCNEALEAVGKIGGASCQQVKRMLNADQFAPDSSRRERPIAQYFQNRFGFSPDCKVLPLTGDNLSAMVGLLPGDVCLSFGTSDTCFTLIADDSPSWRSLAKNYHVMVDPVDVSRRMVMVVFKSGSNARELVKNRSAQNDWSKFNSALMEFCETQQEVELAPSFIFLEKEITPRTNQPLSVRGAFPGNAKTWIASSQTTIVMPLEDVVSCVCTRVCQMKRHCMQFFPDRSSFKRVVVCGGGSNSRGLLQIVADVFGAPVHLGGDGGEAALLGGFRRACPEIEFPPTPSVATPNFGKSRFYQSFCQQVNEAEDAIAKNFN